MKTTLARNLSTPYSIRVGDATCTVRGFEIEPIASLFADDTSASPSSRASAGWAGVVEPEEIVAETMIVPPPVRKRIRRTPSRAILLGVSATE